MSRIKREAVIQYFMHFCNELGKQAIVGESALKAVKKWLDSDRDWEPPCEIVPFNTIGAWRLDYAPIYGGWNIEEIHNEHGGISHPLGCRRHASREFLDLINFARDVLRIKR